MVRDILDYKSALSSNRSSLAAIVNFCTFSFSLLLLLFSTFRSVCYADDFKPYSFDVVGE